MILEGARAPSWPPFTTPLREIIDMLGWQIKSIAVMAKMIALVTDLVHLVLIRHPEVKLVILVAEGQGWHVL